MFPTKVDVFVFMIKNNNNTVQRINNYYSCTTLHSDLYNQKAYCTIYTMRIWSTVVCVVYLRVLLLSLLGTQRTVWFSREFTNNIINFIASEFIVVANVYFFLLILVFLHLLWCLHRIYFIEKCCYHNIIHDLYYREYWNAFE